MITTVSNSQSRILDCIRVLHNQGRPFQADLTFGNGGFWKDGIAEPWIKSDLVEGSHRLTGQNLICDVRCLPFGDRSLQSVVFDPPFIHAPGKTSVMGNRFGGFKSQAALFQMYKESLTEIHRVLAPKGLLVFKNQDIVESGKQVYNHIRVYQVALVLGFDPIDLLVLVNLNRPIGHNHGRQVHARKTHSYFWVFRK